LFTLLNISFADRPKAI